jgi:hypothetical protein
MRTQGSHPQKFSGIFGRVHFSSKLCIIVIASLLSGCKQALEGISLTPSAVPSVIDDAGDAPQATLSIASATLIESSSTPTSAGADGSWKTLPILPTLSPRALEVYQEGLRLGNNPHAFSKVGDGEIATNWFLAVYDLGPTAYALGPYQALSPVINTFAGSFGRQSIAASPGFNTTRILNPLFAANDICAMDESPLECELRLHRPSFTLISLGTNQIWTPEVFEEELNMIVEICIAHGVLPVLATKGDNLEGDHRINAIIGRVAHRYEVPLWNFWLALQSLPDQGLQPDGEHLTWAENDFDDSEVMSHAWPVRNLTALQVLQRLVLELGSS